MKFDLDKLEKKINNISSNIDNKISCNIENTFLYNKDTINELYLLFVLFSLFPIKLNELNEYDVD
tara:strand:- start:4525 stop:4719 length:195 start_codon:yes stop_codon:yes gene_type:complete